MKKILSALMMIGFLASLFNVALADDTAANTGATTAAQSDTKLTVPIAQQPDVKGVVEVVKSGSDRILGGVKITLTVPDDQSALKLITQPQSFTTNDPPNPDGYALPKSLKPGTYRLTAQRTGYVDYEESIEIPDDKTQTIIKIEMTARDYTPIPDETFTSDAAIQQALQRRFGNQYPGTTLGGVGLTNNYNAVVPMRLTIIPTNNLGLSLTNSPAQVKIIDSYNNNVVYNNTININSQQGNLSNYQYACLEQNHSYTLQYIFQTVNSGIVSPTTAINNNTRSFSFTSSSQGTFVDLQLQVTQQFFGIEATGSYVWMPTNFVPNQMTGTLPVNCPATGTNLGGWGQTTGGVTTTPFIGGIGSTTLNDTTIDSISSYKVIKDSETLKYYLANINNTLDKREFTFVGIGEDSNKGFAFVPASSNQGSATTRYGNWYVTTYKRDDSTKLVTIDINKFSLTRISPQDYAAQLSSKLITDFGTGTTAGATNDTA